MLRPSQGFRHKLGFGKPLGLGTVRIDPLAVCLVNREQRYKEQSSLLTSATSQRYGCVELWPDDIVNIDTGTLNAAEQVDSGIVPTDSERPVATGIQPDSWSQLLPETVYHAELHAIRREPTKMEWRPQGESPVADCVSTVFRRQLEVLGNPKYVSDLCQKGAVVSYPLLRGQLADACSGKDIESYRWFSGRDVRPQPLGKLLSNDAANLTLEQLAKRLLLPIGKGSARE